MKPIDRLGKTCEYCSIGSCPIQGDGSIGFTCHCTHPDAPAHTGGTEPCKTRDYETCPLHRISSQLGSRSETMLEQEKGIRLTDAELVGLTPREAADKATAKSAKCVLEFFTDIIKIGKAETFPDSDSTFALKILLILQSAIRRGFEREGIELSGDD